MAYVGVLAPVLAGILGLAAGWFARCWALRLAGGELKHARVIGPLACSVAWASLVGFGGLSLEVAVQCLVCGVFVTCLLTDLHALLIPNDCIVAAIVLWGVLVLGTSLSNRLLAQQLLMRSLAGAAAAFFPLLLLTLVMDRVLGTESMGGGDLKLLTVCGLYVGWFQLILLITMACLGGIASSMLLPRDERGGLAPFPFGPAIAVASWLTFLVGPAVEAWLLAWVF